MSKVNIVVVGASAGGVEALSRLVKGLPGDFPATILVVIHLPAFVKSSMPQILQRSGLLDASHPNDGELLQPGRIYIAPPNHHLVVDRQAMHLTQDPKENGCRPAIDVLFRTAAASFGQSVIGVVLSGMLDDGTAGLIEIKQRGGIAIVQDPNDAMFSGMPQSAIDYAEVDHILPIADIPSLLVRLCCSVDSSQPNADPLDANSLTVMTPTQTNHDDAIGPPSGFICPECGGALWELQKQDFLRFRCRIGHTYSQQTLFAEQFQGLEAALWNAIRLCEGRAALLERLATQARQRQSTRLVQRYEEEIDDLHHNTTLIRQALEQTLHSQIQHKNDTDF